MHDGDVLQIKVFSEMGCTDAVIALVESRVNKYLANYPAELVQSIQSQITEGNEWIRCTVTVVLKS